MKKNEPIKSIMSTNVEAVQQGQALSDVYKIICNTGIHHVPVLDGKKLVGLISYTDMMKLDLAIHNVDAHTITAVMDQQFAIADVITNELVTIRDSDNVRSAAELLGEGDFHSLPVVDADGALVGIVTSTDLIRYLSSQF